jgi:F-type H+-transporting ATPase subunit delta
MSTVHISTRYAKALFELGRESGNLAGLVAELGRMRDAYQASDELRQVLASAALPPASKRAILEELCQRLGLGTIARNAILLLEDKRRTALLPEIVRILVEMQDQAEGALHVEVTTAVPLAEDYYARLGELVKRRFGRQRIVIDKKIDPSILGGVVVRSGDWVRDGSLRTRLLELRTSTLTH